MSAAVVLENWRDKDGKARPTPERPNRGSFILIDGDDAGVAIAIDTSVTTLDRLRQALLITETHP